MAAEYLLATRNKKKLVELSRIFSEALPGAVVLGLDDVAPFEELPESAPTLSATHSSRLGPLALQRVWSLSRMTAGSASMP